MLGIVVSRADSASTAIFDQLRSLADWERTEDDSVAAARGGGPVYRLSGTDSVVVRTFDDLHIDLRDVADPFGELDCLVFASRHAGDTGELLTAHFTGNFGPAEYGGDDRSFARACPNAQRTVVEALSRYAPDGYEVGVECTHHGPTDLDIPSMFVELGSDESAWNDPEGARAVARAILDLRGVAPDVESTDAGMACDEGERVNGGDSVDDDCHGDDPASNRHVVGFGGGHYAPRFERVIRETDWGVGHIGSDWQLDELGDPTSETGRETLRRIFEASATDLAVVEGTKPALVDVVADLGYRVVSESFLRATTGVPRERVAALEDGLCPVDDGLRFGGPARGVMEGSDGEVAEDAGDAAATLDVRSLPADLLEAAQGVDADATRAAIEHHAVAFETSENGTRVEGRGAFVHGGYDRFVDDLLPIVRRKYDGVERSDGVVHATVTEFDPDAAATLGVPEGPAFGKLAAGQAVEVNGRTIEPSAVRSTRNEEFPL